MINELYLTKSPTRLVEPSPRLYHLFLHAATTRESRSYFLRVGVGLTLFGVGSAITRRDFGAIPHVATPQRIFYTLRVEYPFPPVGIVGAADG